MFRQGVVGQYGPQISLKGKQKEQREAKDARPLVDYFDTDCIFSSSTKKRQIGIEPIGFGFMIAPDATGCSTQAELAEKMSLSRSQLNEYIKQFTSRFKFCSGVTYTDRQRASRSKQESQDA